MDGDLCACLPGGARLQVPVNRLWWIPGAVVLGAVVLGADMVVFEGSF